MVRYQHLNCWQVVLEYRIAWEWFQIQVCLEFSFFIGVSSLEIDNLDRKQTCHSRVILEPLPSDPGTTPEWSWNHSQVILEPLRVILEPLSSDPGTTPSDPGTTPEWSWNHSRVILEPLEWSWNHSRLILEPLSSDPGTTPTTLKWSTGQLASEVRTKNNIHLQSNEI